MKEATLFIASIFTIMALMDLALYFAVPMGTQLQIKDYTAVCPDNSLGCAYHITRIADGTTTVTTYAYARIPSFQVAVHEYLHTQGEGETTCELATGLQIIAYLPFALIIKGRGLRP